MKEIKLGRWQRWLSLVVACAALGGALMQVPSALVLLTRIPESPLALFTAAILTLNALVLLMVAIFFIRTSVRGMIRRDTPSTLVACMWVGYVAAMGGIVFVVGRYLPDTWRNEIRGAGGFLVIYAAVAWVRYRVAQAERRTAERLGEIEARLEAINRTLESLLPAADLDDRIRGVGDALFDR